MTEITSKLSTALSSSYKIERHLGEGGMATVYLAEDLKHKRKVAVKVLRPELAAVLGGERFLNEIKVTANLQHPHILQLYDSGEADSHLYYVMPYIEGESLREKLNREKQLSIEETVEITKVVASALDFAHKRDIVHRDIKPENILLQGGVALVADFGIAVAMSSVGGDRLTETGLSIGTPAYMSPEQIAGQRDLDARSDVYSLACVTYEMLAGDPPFVSSNAQAVMAKHVTDPAPPITTTRPSVSPTIAHAIAKALNKTPVDRYESAGAFAAGLTTKGDPPPEGKSVAVLPFVNRSADPNDEYFSDGLTDEVISDLSRMSALHVISRNSSMMLKGTTKDTRTLARELGVTHLVTGTVRRAGAALRITAELVEASTDTPIWSEKLSGTMDDVFGIQEEISRQIVAALKVRLTDTEERGVAERPIDDPVAYDCYLRARQVLYDWTPEDQHRALRLVEDAIDIVGDSPLLLATKANIHWSQVNMHVVPAEEGLARASALVDQALALDPDFYLAIYVRGLVAGMRGQPEAALVDLYRAHSLRPNDLNILSELIRYSNFSGLRNTWKYAEKIAQIDPLTSATQLNKVYLAVIYGPCEAAAAPARRVIALAPQVSMLHVYAGWPLAEAGFRDEAAEILGRVGTAITDNPHGPLALFLSYALDGREEEALRVATPEMEKTVHNDIACRMMADGYALLGRKRDAIRWVRTAIEHGFINYPNLSEGALFLKSLRAEPEFHALMAELKPRWEALVEWERGLPGS